MFQWFSYGNRRNTCGGSYEKRSVRGFTLIELLVVIAIIAFASAGVGLALRDGSQGGLDREADRLAALLEAARAQSRASGIAVRWVPVAGGFRFDGLPPGTLPAGWLDASTGVAGPGNGTLVLGPEPLIGAQQVLLVSARQPDRVLRVATDGLRPFAVQP
ncbi:prepilin-type N-terminal cleavage/methylation domain-containing protein [Ramlibacter sp. H39-3-26]|uniref:prepilin-type N-terminal cleavage/methylation domain-containing protein n=1 Tax=Curvibacter soli TaxID=3031331 RepID=UPI0023DC15A1|nr:prepilin-type N-terminal cleavage/methylation domain-containing protein [Ramlibacter sp. H39-3-26]MDF1483725.1 prepilin-type N-terminal cleavage/methylation domain-containing protein [Ramlibacter sp. H39-3-26]